MPIVRESNVSFERWNDFRNAVNDMINNGTYGELAKIHANMQHRMHGRWHGNVGVQRFLPWHRAYLIAFERELRKIDDTLSLPYWDWENDEGRLDGFVNFLAIASRRNTGQPLGPGNRRWFFNSQQAQDLENSNISYLSFSQDLEVWPHNVGHSWVGGDMATMSSPNDIAFWLHHAAIDRLWARWQTNNPGKRAVLSEVDEKLDPWDNEFTVDNIDDISNLGPDSYSYT
ncbi:MAG: tyrosinase family protein [Nitrospinae bacterium]|nr:tyrosinase family protein [Nitrospinota bacterium]